MVQNMKIVILDSYPLNSDDLSWEPLKEFGELTVFERTKPHQIAERIADANAVFTNKVRLDEEHLSNAPQLKFIGETATGTDNIAVAAAKQHGIVVSNVPSYSASFTAQTTIALLLELTHHVAENAAAVAAGEWSASADFSFWKRPLVDLEGKIMLIIGLGNIGSKVAQISTALGMTVVAAQLPYREYGSDSNHLPLDAALPLADVISLHCPLKPETKGLINAAFLARMKKTAFLINAGRGGLINEVDLAEALNNGTIAGYAADVLSVEPPSADNPLLTAPNTIITPHLGWASPEARQRCLNISIENLKAFIDGNPQNVVN
jgi:glycerate dehydrogenase